MQDTYRVVWWLQLLIGGLIHRLTVRWQHLWMRQGTTWISRRSITWRNRVTRSEITWRNRAIRLASARVTRVFVSQGTAVTFVTYFRQRARSRWKPMFPPSSERTTVVIEPRRSAFHSCFETSEDFCCCLLRSCAACGKRERTESALQRLATRQTLHLRQSEVIVKCPSHEKLRDAHVYWLPVGNPRLNKGLSPAGLRSRSQNVRPFQNIRLRPFNI